VVDPLRARVVGMFTWPMGAGNVVISDVALDGDRVHVVSEWGGLAVFRALDRPLDAQVWLPALTAP
jgi:hypothetical protein